MWVGVRDRPGFPSAIAVVVLVVVGRILGTCGGDGSVVAEEYLVVLLLTLVTLDVPAASSTTAAASNTTASAAPVLLFVFIILVVVLLLPVLSQVSVSSIPLRGVRVEPSVLAAPFGLVLRRPFGRVSGVPFPPRVRYASAPWGNGLTRLILHLNPA